MLWMPALSVLIRMVPEPLATRSISKLSDGMSWPWASMIIGTRRTMPSRSGLIVNSPRPAAASSRTGTLRNRPGKLNMNRCGSSPSVARPVNGRFLSRSVITLGNPDSPSTTRDALDRIGEDLVVARQRPQSGAGLLVEIAKGVGGNVRIEPVGLGEHHVERDHERAELGQIGDDVGDARARPRPLPEPGIS